MKLKLLLGVPLAIFLAAISAAAVVAQEEVPSPYAGVKNPFKWDDPAVQASGKNLYKQSCLGCHGIKGGNLAQFDFSKPEYAAGLETKPDYYFWALSEGRMSKGMPGYKASLTDEQRWQLLTYMWSLGRQAAPPPAAAATPPAGETAGNLSLSVPRQGKTGEPLPLSVTLLDEEGKPLQSAKVKFLVRVSFFDHTLMDVGDAVTDENGVAVLEYAPRDAGEVEIVARYGTTEASTTVALAGTRQVFYEPEVGVKLPGFGSEIFIGPRSAHTLDHLGRAPGSALRLPGGILSWLLLPTIAVLIVWWTYLRVMFQLVRIPLISRFRDEQLKLIPWVGVALVVAVGAMLALKIIIGPYSHFHLP